MKISKPATAMAPEIEKQRRGKMLQFIDGRTMWRARIIRVFSACGMTLALGWTTLAAGGITEALSSASGKGDLAAVEAQLDKGADVNAKDNEGMTALMFASEKGHLDVTKALLAKGAAVNVKTNSGWTALMFACWLGRDEVAKVLLSVGAQDSLFSAAGRGDSAAVNSFLSKRSDLNAKTRFGLTALAAAAKNGHDEVVRALIVKGADINVKDDGGQTALILASRHGNLDVVLTLLAKGAKINTQDKDGGAALLHASQTGQTEIVKALLARGAEVNAQSKTGVRSLFLAAEKGSIGVVQALLDKGAEVDARRPTDGATSLMEASYRGHTDVVRALLAKGADVNAKTKDGATALFLAAEWGHLGAVQALLDRGAEPNAARTTDGRTSLVMAAKGGYAGIVRALLARGAGVNIKVDTGETALIAASEKGSIGVVQELLDKGADVNAAIAADGRTSLVMAAKNGYTDVVRALLAKGADASIKTTAGETALIIAAENRHSNVVQALLAKNADAKEVNQSVLAKMALEDTNSFVRRAVVDLVTDQAVLVKVALEDANDDVCQAAVTKMTDQAALAKIAMQASSGTTRLAALKRVTDESWLERIREDVAVVTVDANAWGFLETLTANGYAFFTSREHPIHSLADLTDPNNQFGVLEFSDAMFKLRYMLGRGSTISVQQMQSGAASGRAFEPLENRKTRASGETSVPGDGVTLLAIGEDAFGSLFQKKPDLRLFVTPRGTRGVNLNANGGIRVRFVATANVPAPAIVAATATVDETAVVPAKAIVPAVSDVPATAGAGTTAAAKEAYRRLRKEDAITLAIRGAVYLSRPDGPSAYIFGAFVLVDARGKDIELEVDSHTYTSDSMFIKTKLFGPLSVLGDSGDTFGATEAQIVKIHEFLSAQAKSSAQLQGASADTWTDPSTGLMWASKDNGANVTAAQAEEYCRNLNLAGFRDWRLPTIAELKGIYDGKAGGSGPGVYSASGSGSTKGTIVLSEPLIWSSSQADTPQKRKIFLFSGGMTMSDEISSADCHVLAVHGPSK